MDEQRAAATAEAGRVAMAFVRDVAGFAQVTTLDRRGFPVGRTMTAFLEDDWSVSLVQRRSHARLAQMRREPRALVTWVGGPAPDARNDHPHVFDVGLLPPRAVFVRGRVEFMDEAWTEACYRRNVEQQRGRGLTAAPLRTPDEVARDLVGVRIDPVRVRLEGFGEQAEAFEWDLATGNATSATTESTTEGEA